MAGSVDGMISGLDTSTIISQLMRLERTGQDRLKTRQAATESSITALRALNTRFLSIVTAAKALTATTGWNAAAATTSDAARASATSKPGALAGDLTFTVTQLASSEVWKTSGTVGSIDAQVATAGASFTITKDGVSTPVSVGDGTLGSVVTAINAAGTGVRASAVQVAPGSFSLQLSSSTSGSTTLSVGSDPFAATLGPLAQLTPGRDALLQVGVAADGTGGYQVTRTTNTVDDLLKGTTITLLKQDPGTPVSVTVAGDSAKVADGVAAMVDAVNAALHEITRTGSYDAASKRGGVLHGDSSVRSLRGQLVNAVTGGSGTSPALAGVSVQRDGSVAFDRSRFLTALAADPEGVQARLGAGTPETVVGGVTTPAVPGLAGRLTAVADAASRGQGAAGGTGILTAAVANRERSSTSLRTDISRWDQRLKLREERLVAQFARLETVLGSAQQQGQWLAGQIAGLPGYGGST
jgi:flagellar hook-associated protein 2